MSKTERPFLLVMRRGSMLIPVAPLDSDRIMELPVGRPLKAVLTQPRSVPQHRLYWAALRLICENIDGNIPTQVMHEVVKVKLGYTTTVHTKSGPVTIPGSVAFEAMNQTEFRDFFERFKDFVAAEIIPGISKTRFEREATLMLTDQSTGSEGPDRANNPAGAAA